MRHRNLEDGICSHAVRHPSNPSSMGVRKSGIDPHNSDRGKRLRQAERNHPADARQTGRILVTFCPSRGSAGCLRTRQPLIRAVAHHAIHSSLHSTLERNCLERWKGGRGLHASSIPFGRTANLPPVYGTREFRSLTRAPQLNMTLAPRHPHP